ncbi:hypothetical protein [Methanogenium cariaci]|uniref:hypothetical protein n=1 Tax=Methanogenium cariaci TaxID=2197 RepID=UPI000785BD6B|nr:hypothetical protein [Methanogenium cariaci]
MPPSAQMRMDARETGDVPPHPPHDIKELEGQQKDDTHHGVDDQFADILEEVPEGHCDRNGDTQCEYGFNHSYLPMI